MRRSTIGLAVSAAALLWLSPSRVTACAIEENVYFWSPNEPDEPLDRYLDGHLGVLDLRNERLAYLYVAYRYLNGQGLDAPSREVLATYFRTPRPAVEPYRNPSWDLWMKARARVAPAGPPMYGGTMRALTKTVDGVERSFYYENCLDDAFRTAASTLDQRLDTFGAGPTVQGWVEAQDQVFRNCGDRTIVSIPDPLPEGAPPLAVADRSYQIAAAHFYAGQFEEAEQRFRAIAQDSASPWEVLAAYLVGRALVRQGTLDEPLNRGRLEAAAAHLRAVLADPALAAVHQPAERLLAYSTPELDPEAKQRELAAQLAAPTLGPSAGDTLFDYLWLLRREGRRPASWPAPDPRPAPAAEDMGAWIIGFDVPDESLHERSLPWLVYALANAGATTPALPKLLAAADRVPADSPAALTIAYHRIRLAIEQGETAEARRRLEALLGKDGSQLRLGERNRFLALSASIARDQEEFLRLSQKVPVEVGSSDESIPLDTVPADSPAAALRGLPMLDAYGGDVVNRYFTPAMLLEALRRDELAANLRPGVAQAAWVRALLAGEDDVAKAIATPLAELVPTLRPDIEAQASAPSAAAREFALAFAFLRNRALGFEVPAEASIPWSGWRCATPAYIYGTAAPDRTRLPPFVDAERRAAAAAMHDRIRARQPGELWLGRTALAWAEKHPDDPRAPEALHHVVTQSREGCTKDDSATAKAAFRLLHRRYPKCPWTEKTPYWYR